MLAKEALPYLEKQGGGKIIFISSIAGFQPFSVKTYLLFMQNYMNYLYFRH